MTYQVTKSDAEWREQLSRDEYQVLRKAGTEAPFVGEYTDTKTEGVYRCRACRPSCSARTRSSTRTAAGRRSTRPLAEDRVEYIEDRSMGSVRTEVRCANCGSHLGHVFEGEGYGTPTDQRYCINSISLTLEPGTSDCLRALCDHLGTAGRHDAWSHRQPQRMRRRQVTAGR